LSRSSQYATVANVAFGFYTRSATTCLACNHRVDRRPTKISRKSTRKLVSQPIPFRRHWKSRTIRAYSCV